MRNKKLWFGAVLLLSALTGFGLLQYFSKQKVKTAQGVDPQVIQGTPVVTPNKTAAKVSELANAQLPPAKRIERTYLLLQNYVSAMKSRKGPPLSTNAEFTAAFTGKNPLGIAFLESTNPAINEQGELVDPWNTPYFFHALAADSYELISAGPDKIKFNRDDIIFPRRANINSLKPLKFPSQR